MSIEALSIWAEAAQDMVTTGLEIAKGRNYACADYCNQVAEKAVQAVGVVKYGHRVVYDHDLARLGKEVGAPQEIIGLLEALTPYHPDIYYQNVSPQDADDSIDSETADSLMKHARQVLQWARKIVMAAS